MSLRFQKLAAPEVDFEHQHDRQIEPAERVGFGMTQQAFLFGSRMSRASLAGSAGMAAGLKGVAIRIAWHGDVPITRGNREDVFPQGQFSIGGIVGDLRF